MVATKSLPTLVSGLICCLLSLLNLAWVWHLLVGSQHMGSPLRRYEHLIANAAADSQLSHFEHLIQTGQLGFDLLESSMWVHLGSGLVLALIGAFLVGVALYQRSQLGRVGA
jgi:hypothetical protein